MTTAVEAQIPSPRTSSDDLRMRDASSEFRGWWHGAYARTFDASTAHGIDDSDGDRGQLFFPNLQVKQCKAHLLESLGSCEDGRRLSTDFQTRLFLMINHACWCSLDSDPIFAYYAGMFSTPSGRKTFVVTCKRCRRDVPSGREEFPFQSIMVECCLCREVRRYLPSEVFFGRPDQLVTRQHRTGDGNATG